MQDSGSPAPSLLIVVPRERPDLDRSLRQSFGDDAGVRLIADRRRRGAGTVGAVEPIGTERRRRAERDAALDAGRWIVVPLAAPRVDLSDPDARAILFLCCGEHVVACESCQDTYRFLWLRRDETGACACPRCDADLTAAVGAHTATCPFWAGRVKLADEQVAG